MRTTFAAAIVAFSTLSAAHFNLDYPVVRGFDEDKLGTFPCGSFDTPSTNRTLWPISGGEIGLTMGHINANVEVLIGFGDDVGTAFNTVLRQTFQETGLGSFCMTGFALPDGLNVTEGTNATIQVVTNGDPDGGLYNCADITFTTQAVTVPNGSCKNGTGVTASSATISGSPNGTTSGSPSTTSSGPAAATSTKGSGAAAGLKVSMYGVLAALVGALFF